MSKFRLVKLADLVKRVKVGFVGPINEYYCDRESGIPLIRTTDLDELGINYSSLKYVTREFHNKNKKSQVKRNDLIIARHGDNGKANVFKEDFEAQVLNAVIIEPDPIKMDSNLLKLFFDSPFVKRQILGVVKGSVQGVINTSHVAEILLPINNEIDYDKLAKIIGDLDSKISTNNRINAELEAMTKTIYDYWFVQFDFPNKNGKPYKATGGKMVWSEELKREIPEGWDSSTIGEMLSKEPSRCKVPSSEYLQKGEIPVIDQSTDFIAGFTNNPDALISVSQPYIIFGDHTRILKLINFDFARGADGTQVLLSSENRMPQHLFYCTLLKFDLSNYGYARHFKFLKDMNLVLPDLSLAEKFEAIAKASYEKVKHNIFENQKLTELRDWLLPMLMNGQIKIKDAEEELAMAAEPDVRYEKRKTI